MATKKRAPIPGQVTILLSADGAEIEIHDKTSGLLICTVTMDGPAVMRALARQAMVPGQVTLYHEVLAPIGYTHEAKTETVDFTHVPEATDRKYHRFDQVAAVKAAGIHETDGWRIHMLGSHADWNNHHRRVPGVGPDRGKTLYRVTYTRYVHPVSGVPWQYPYSHMLVLDQPSSSTAEDILEKA